MSLKQFLYFVAAVAVITGCAIAPRYRQVNLSPSAWPAGEYQRYLAAQSLRRDRAGEATGYNGAVTVAYNGLAARAGLEALKQGGNAIDAAMTTALTQVALTAGAPISYFGILSLVYYDAASDKVYTMNAEWNTVRGESDPMSIPGGFNFATQEGKRGLGKPSGRTALVGGFMKGVGAAHKRFGRLPWAQLFEPAIYIAENGMPVTDQLAEQIAFRREDLSRLPETRAVFTKPDGSFYTTGDWMRQPALAKTLRAVAAQGADYMYKGPWAGKLVAAVQADGGKMTLEDLAAYEVIWNEPLVAPLPGGYTVYTNPWPNGGGVALIEAQNLAAASGLLEDGPWWKSSKSLRKALDITYEAFTVFLPKEVVSQLYPGMDFSPAARITPEHAKALWARMQAGARVARWEQSGPKHSDDVVAVDRDGNMAAITHSANTIFWGKTAIVVDGVSIPDAASFQQAQIAQVKPGGRLPAPTETGILFKDGKPALAFASMGAGLHQRTFQCLLNVIRFGLSVPEAINAPDFFLPATDPKTLENTVQVPSERFPKSVLDGVGYDYREVPQAEARLGGEGLWVAISRDPSTGKLEAGSHNRNNSAAVAY